MTKLVGLRGPKAPKRPGITPEALRHRLAYNAETGELTWLPRPVIPGPLSRITKCWNVQYVGKPALNYADGKGYRRGSVNNESLLAHRVAWALHYGVWPIKGLDHIDGNPSNNSIANLREVDQSVNAKNSRARANNGTGVTGVHWNRSARKYWASINVDREYKYLGFFEKFEDAVAARKAAEVHYGFGPNHGRRP